MAFRLFPISSFPATEGSTYPDVLRTNTNDFWIEGLGVKASLSADAELHYVFHVPTPLPSGTAKLEVLAFSYEASGDAKFNPKWKSIAVGEDFDLAASSLNAEGTQTLTWSTGDGHKFKRSKITLDADTVTADEFIALRLAMESTSWTLDDRSIWIPAVIWE
jgi:hypothetical protein